MNDLTRERGPLQQRLKTPFPAAAPMMVTGAAGKSEGRPLVSRTCISNGVPLGTPGGLKKTTWIKHFLFLIMQEMK